jgi:hypothetical protein
MLATDWSGCDRAAIFPPTLTVSPPRSSNQPPACELRSNVLGPVVAGRLWISQRRQHLDGASGHDADASGQAAARMVRSVWENFANGASPPTWPRHDSNKT